jgi:hypothetical protein
MKQTTRLMQRRFKLASKPASLQLAIVREELRAMVGIEQVEIKGDQINLTYDLFQCMTAQMEERLNQAEIRS